MSQRSSSSWSAQNWRQRWYGWNCDDSYGCGGQVPADDYVDLLVYTDLNQIGDRSDVQESFDVVAAILSEHDDPRGLFPALTAVTFRNGVSAVDAGGMEYPEWTDAYVRELGSIYLWELRRDLVDGTMDSDSYWNRYFELVDDCTASPLRIAAVGLTTHLVSDVPDAISFSGGTDYQERDFFLLGDVVGASSDEMVAELYSAYGINGQSFLDGLYKDDWDGTYYGSDMSGVFSYAALEDEGWVNGLWLQNGWVAWAARSDIYSLWNTMDGILATLDQTGAL
jgi:hypothetical protein